MAVYSESEDSWRSRCYGNLVEGHGLRLLRYLQGMLGVSEEAEDLAQDVFLKAWAGRSSLQDEAHARSWLYAIAANTARSHLRSLARRKSEPLDGDDLRDPAPRIDDQVPTVLAVRAALAALDSKDREILLLKGLAGLSATEAAEILGIRVEAAHKRWQRACKRFEESLEGAE